MKIFTGKFVFFPIIAALALVGGCESKESTPSTQIANPASEYCVKQGGKLEIIKGDSGEQGMCHLPDGTVVEEWEFFRQDNPQE